MRVVRLSALVCVQNQDRQLSACLRRLSFCDEIVVVADRCTDRSQEIARRHGAIVIDGIFPLESQRRQAGVEACSGEWILEVEPDEQVDAALAWEIRAMLQMRPTADCFEIPIDNYVGETLVRSGWAGELSPAAATRLHRRGVKSWRPRRLDPGVTVDSARAGALKGAIRRDLGSDVGGVLERLNRLTALSAEDMADAGRPGRVGGGIVSGIGHFASSYVARGGWREGRLGVLAALLCGLYPVIARMRAQDVLESRRAAAAEAERRTGLGQVIGLAR